MNFRTEIEPLRHKGEIAHDTPLVLLGSCFTTEIGARLKSELFSITVNPLGVMYNPASIACILEYASGGFSFTHKELIEHNGLYHTFMSHSSLSGIDPADTLARHNAMLCNMRDAIARASWLIITLGTAWVFRLKSDNSVVSNCHKLPAGMFTRERMDVSECTEHLHKAIQAARRINPDIKVMFTVSPIRHAADGAHGNQLSKATLLLSVDSVKDDSTYFPSYEILMDDLRDYRFYATDMRHPSDTAVDYIYHIFSQSFFSERTMALTKECRALTRRMAHRTMSADPNEITKNREEIHKAVNQLATRYPFLLNSIKEYIKCHSD
ncbi:MAG: GSCFA domain-containing protein [Muribaculaceae bacterium]|nr:GSCFA domain-containing protein [Muribaculaceae bacterium]